MRREFMSFGGYLDQFRSGANQDLQRLGAMQANEGPAADARVEEQLLALEGVQNRVGMEADVRKAASLSERMSDNQAAQFERSTRSLDLSARQKKSATRRLGLSRSLNRARASGAIRRGYTDRSNAASRMGQGLADTFFAQRLSGQSQLASADAAEQGRLATNAANEKVAKRELGSKIGGMAISALMMMSSEKVKDNHGREKGLLDKLKKVRVNRWNYKGDEKTHVGPFAEEFNREFGTDTDRPDMINVIDAIGVTLGAVKELNEKVDARGS